MHMSINKNNGRKQMAKKTLLPPTDNQVTKEEKLLREGLEMVS